MKRMAIMILLLLVLAVSVHSKQQVDHVKLMIGFTPNVGYAPFYMAALPGSCYEQEGITIDILYNVDGVGPAVQLLGLGHVDFVYGGDAAVVSAAKEQIPITAIHKIIQKNLFRLVIREDSDIETLDDFIGKRIGFSGPTSGDTAVARVILGNRWSEVDFRYVGGTTISTFVSGATEGMGAYLPQQVIAEGLLGRPARAFLGSDYTTLGTTYLYTSQGLARDNPELAQRFTSATQCGLEMAIADVHAAVDAFVSFEPAAQENQELHRDIWTAMIEQGFDRDDDNAVVYELPSQDHWNEKIQQMLDVGLIEERFDLTNYITDAFAWVTLGAR